MDLEYGVIFIYTASKYTGNMKSSIEGELSWIKKEEITKLKQFDMNSKFNELIFQEGMFEGRFELDQENKVKSYKLTKI